MGLKPVGSIILFLKVTVIFAASAIASLHTNAFLEASLCSMDAAGDGYLQIYTN